jgi:hypothetical protein
MIAGVGRKGWLSGIERNADGSVVDCRRERKQDGFRVALSSAYSATHPHQVSAVKLGRYCPIRLWRNRKQKQHQTCNKPQA